MTSLRIPSAVIVVAALVSSTLAYPPSVGIMGMGTSCLDCHVNNGPWIDDDLLVVDLLDRDTKQSLRQPDGTFLVEVPRNISRTVLCIIGRLGGDSNPPPFRNGWIFFDRQMVEKPTVSNFLPGWEVNATYGCRLVGDKLDLYPGAAITVTSMTIRPTDEAKDGILTWMLALTVGDPPKGNPDKGMLGNYYEHMVKLKVRSDTIRIR